MWLMNILLLAPHQDYEILSACLFLKKHKELGDNINIVFATNGDFFGDKVAKIRYKESCSALNQCGIQCEQIHYMGYGDTGMELNRSFLWKLYCAKSTVCFSANNHQYTWHPAKQETIHKLFTGEEAIYCRKYFLMDLYNIINKFQPDLLIIPSGLDRHGDHKAVSFFVNEIAKKIPNNYKTWCYLIHTAKESKWPNRQANHFIKPSEVYSNVWKKRISIQFSYQDCLFKKNVIDSFKSQYPKANSNFLLSFAKTEEIFFQY